VFKEKVQSQQKTINEMKLLKQQVKMTKMEEHLEEKQQKLYMYEVESSKFPDPSFMRSYLSTPVIAVKDLSASFLSALSPLPRAALTSSPAHNLLPYQNIDSTQPSTSQQASGQINSFVTFSPLPSPQISDESESSDSGHDVVPSRSYLNML
jgi:hypothetical protein